MTSLFTDPTDSSSAPHRGWLFYDGACQFCTRCVRRFEPTLLARGFHCAALQDPWVAPLLGCSPAELLRALRLRLNDGSTLVGVEAVVYLAGFIPWARPLAWLARLPGMMALLRRLYGAVAARRHCLSFSAPKQCVAGPMRGA